MKKYGTQYTKIQILMTLMLVFISACHKIDVAVSPSIEIDQMTYRIKSGEQIKITPIYKDIEEADARYSWLLDGEVVGTEPTYVFGSQTVGRYTLRVSVTTSTGSDQKEITIEVVDAEAPIVSLSEESGVILEVGDSHKFSPDFSTDKGLNVEWKIDDEAVSTSKTYTFDALQEGTYYLSLTATNADGTEKHTIRIDVVAQVPLTLSFPYPTRVAVSGRPCRITADVSTLDGVTFEWTVDGRKVEGQSTHTLDLEPLTVGTRDIRVTATKGSTTKTQQITLRVVAPDQHYRPFTSGKSAKWDKVYSFLPAPGQFINVGVSATDMPDAIRQTEERLRAESFVSLGGFGGYVVLGFDHSIVNSGDYDFTIEGNSFEGNSEPGIVWVMQDENGDGIPNDTWYELKGSESGKPETISDYAVTYYRPATLQDNILWKDNRGNVGSIDRNDYHPQDYYPLWVKPAAYTLYGTRLQHRTHRNEQSFWVSDAFPWGYADNFSSIDRLTVDTNHNAKANSNHFKISNAIDHRGAPVKIAFIDFVKVQTAVNVKAGIVGEISTEVFGAEDDHPDQAISTEKDFF